LLNPRTTLMRLNPLCAAALWAVTLSLAACSAGGFPGSNSAPPTSIPYAPPGSNPQALAAPTPQIPAKTPADLHLSGRLFFVQGHAGITLLDLATNRVTTVFKPPADSLVSAASLSPDGKHIVMSYSPPPASNAPQLGYTRLFIMPADGSAAPQPLLRPQDENGLLYLYPSWSPDGKTITFGHFSPDDAGDQSSGFSLERITYPDGQPTKVIPNAFQARPSADGSQLTYVSLTDPTTPINELYVASSDGSNPHKVTPLDSSLWTIDAPTFSRDGQTIVFSGVTNQPKVLRSWFDRLLGVTVAEAHNIPSDLWSVPASGGKPRNLAHLNDIGLYPAFSPDGSHIAFLSFTGIYVMNPDGTQLAQISALGGAGTLEWLP
jgi:Tol biopolymer transport system component